MELFGKIVFGILIAAALYFLINYVRIKTSGVETDAVVTDTDVRIDYDSEGSSIEYICFVSYRTEEEEQIEARIINGKKWVKKGDHVRIKYLPSKPRSPLLVTKKKDIRY